MQLTKKLTMKHYKFKVGDFVRHKLMPDRKMLIVEMDDSRQISLSNIYGVRFLLKDTLEKRYFTEPELEEWEEETKKK